MSDAFERLLETLAADPEVSRGKMFGHAGARLGRKFFAMEYEEDVVVKLGPERVAALVASGRARQFEPMAGRPMSGWAQVPPGEGDPVPFWAELADEAKALVRELERPERQRRR